MPPSPHFLRRRMRRRAVSELYASMLMVGVTLSLGSVVTYAAMGQFSLSNGAANLGASLDQSSAGVQLGLVYVAVTPSGSCPLDGGYSEGTSMIVSVYNYGAEGFTPAEFVVNSTAYAGAFATVGPGTLAEYTLSLGSCAHQWGQTLLAIDPLGDEEQLES